MKQRSITSFFSSSGRKSDGSSPIGGSSENENTSKRSRESNESTPTKSAEKENGNNQNAKKIKLEASKIKSLHDEPQNNKVLSDEDSPIKRNIKKKKAFDSDSENESTTEITKPLEPNRTSITPVKEEKLGSIKNSPDSKLKDEDCKEKATKPNSPDNKKKNGIEKSSSPKPSSSKKTSVEKNNSNLPDTYNPAKTKYHPIKDAIWKREQKIPYLALAKTLMEIEEISSRLKIIEILSNYFRSCMVLTPEDLLPSVYLCLNKLGPAYEGLELGVAETSLMKAIAQSTGRTLNQIKSDVKETGDLGTVAEHSRTNQKTLFQPPPLSVRGVFKSLKQIAKMTGHASQSTKIEEIKKMFVACKEMEARYLIRSLAGKLRIGLAELSVLQALALACATTPPNQDFPPKRLDVSKEMGADDFKAFYDKLAFTLRNTYCECPNYDLMIPVLLKEGIEKLPEHCKLTPGIPLKPMLAHPTKGVQEVLNRFEGLKFTCEWKYDGERAQIHMDGKTVHIYSRNQENNTSKYPDIISRLDLCKSENVKSCILDCEAVAWDSENKAILPFQVLSTRKKKGVKEEEIKVQVCVFMFDLLYFNGESLIKKPFIERRTILKENFKECEGHWYFATYLDTSKMEEVQEFLEESVKGNCEGLMVKTLEQDATYEIAKRSHNWLKLKKDYLEGVGDTLDVVVIGGYLGKGKRTGTYGGFLLACYDQDNEEYQSICKIGTGFTDENLQKHTEFFKDHVVQNPKPYYRFEESLTPDHWFEPVQVWEIKCADLSLSPIHRAGIGIVDPQKGISLRFPRFIRIRDDKTVEEATSAQQVADMYSGQDQIKNQQSSVKVSEEDFY
ncbi:DNA ligase 1 isoform X2 [Coccinella septempunctata]|uniref:DNA ligase 1 isoform X2 n=1 Tax=Coccinella septempunctata TaxID=41139 RepID=UPI001D06F7B9|nr:DNA ligase 1 isoform X2 [Coccinella septempunctata]